MSKDLIGVLVDTLNKTEVEVASLFNEDGTMKPEAKTTILEWDSERVKLLKSGTTKTAFDDGYKKAQSETMSKFETDLKTKTGFKSDKKGVDLVLDYVAAQKPVDVVTDDVVKKHPLYLTLQEQSQVSIDAAKTEGETKLKQFQSEISKKESFKTVEQKALEIFHAQKPILSKDPIRAKAQEKLFIDQLKGFDYEIQGDRIVVLRDGKVFENNQGHAVAFEKLIKDTTTTNFDLHTVDPKSTPGHKNNPDPNKTFNFEVPKTDDDYAKIMSDPSKSLEERLAIDEAFSKSKVTTS
jgi:hypothetical protein